MQMLKRKNLALLVPVLTILAMGCSNNDDGGSGSNGSNGGGSPSVAVTGVSLDKTSEVIYVGSSTTLTATIAPSNASNTGVTWKSSDESVATVDNNGKVTGVDGGTATITVKTDDGSHTATATITVELPVSGMTLNTASKTIYVGGFTYLKAKVFPSNANQAVTWSTGNDGVAIVDQNGKVTAVSAGVATITATTADGSHTATATITVETPVTGVSIIPTNKTIYVGDSTILTAMVAPSNATNQKVKWKTSNDGVATVDQNGKVTAVSAGVATITVTTDDGGKTATANITVKVHVASVSLNKTNEIIYVGGSTTLTAAVSPNNASNKKVTWESSDKSVATVTGGVVTGVSGGNATITVTTEDGSKTATADITVVSPETMVGVPTNGSSTITFPTKTDDSGSDSINHKFSMAQTEVTYELWKKVYDWASTTEGTCAATGQYCYTFANQGKEGSNGIAGVAPTATKNEPVTNISWRDAIVWCNAYTEWYNAEKGGSLSVVYYTDGSYTTPLRTSTNGTVPNPLSSATAGSEDKPYIRASSNGNTDMANNIATGFRLPTSAEWEFAARLRTDSTYAVASNTPSGVTYPITIGGTSYWFTKGDAGSGGSKKYNDSNTDIGDFAWYKDNSATGGSKKTHDVATKEANALGLYDMTGNVWEWCFNRYDSSYNRVFRGGSWSNYVDSLPVGNVGGFSPDHVSDRFGFRVVRTQ